MVESPSCLFLRSESSGSVSLDVGRLRYNSPIMSVVLKTHRFSVEEYHRLGETGILREDDRVELIEGELVDMAPMGSRHAGCVSFLTWALQQQVGERAVVHVQNPLALGMDSEPEPDVMLLAPRDHDPFYRAGHPGPDDVLLLVEVADTSLTYDRQVKLPLYARHGIRQVWLVESLGRGDRGSPAAGAGRVWEGSDAAPGGGGGVRGSAGGGDGGGGGSRLAPMALSRRGRSSLPGIFCASL